MGLEFSHSLGETQHKCCFTLVISEAITLAAGPFIPNGESPKTGNLIHT